MKSKNSATPLLAIFLSVLVIFSVAAGAQGKKGAEITLRIASVVKPPQEHYYLTAGKETPLKVTVSSWKLSKSITLTRGKNYYLTTQIHDAKKGEGPATYAVCSFSPTSSAKEIIGILFRQPKSTAGQTWRLHQIRAGAAHFKAGQRKVFNLSSYPIQIKYAGKVVQIPAKRSENLKIPESLNGQFIPVHGVFSPNPGSKRWRWFLSTRWTANKHTRSIIFVYPQRATKSLTYHGLDDSLE